MNDAKCPIQSPMPIQSRFPEWLQTNLDKIKSHYCESSRQHLTTYEEEYSFLLSQLEIVPDTIECEVLVDYSPSKVQSSYGDGLVGLSNACESMFCYWSTLNICKMKSWATGLSAALEEGNFLLAASCSRGLFEQVVHFDYFLSRAKNHHFKIFQLANEARNIKERKLPAERVAKEIISSHVSLINLLLKSELGSDYKWGEWAAEIDRAYKSSSLEYERSDFYQERKTHINDCLRHIEAEHKISAASIYDKLCDLVHPNFGSNTLVISTRKQSGSYEWVHKAFLASAPKNAEAAAWFFELVAEDMSKIFLIGRKDFVTAQNMLRDWQCRKPTGG